MNNFRLKENSQIYVAEIPEENNNNRQLAILKWGENNRLITLCKIPYPAWLEEVEDDFGDPNNTRLVTCTFNQNRPGTTLDSFSINLEEGKVYRRFCDKPITTSGFPSCIYPGVYCYKNQYGQTFLTTAYRESIILDRPFLALSRELKIEIDNLKEGLKELAQEDTLKYPNIKELLVSIGSEESLHLFIKLPIKPDEEFLVYKHITSKMTGLEYVLWDDEENYKSFYQFEYYFSKSDLAQEIAYINKYTEEQTERQNNKAHQKLLQHFTAPKKS